MRLPALLLRRLPHSIERCKTCGGNGLVVGSSGRPEDGPDPCPDCSPRCVICGKEGLAHHRPPLCEKCRHEASASETLKRLPVLNDPAIGEAMRVTEEAFMSDDEEYTHVPPLPKDGDQGIGVECGECGLKFTYEQLHRRFCCEGRCPLQRFNRSATA